MIGMRVEREVRIREWIGRRGEEVEDGVE